MLKVGWISPTGAAAPPGSDGAPQGEPMSNGFRLFWEQAQFRAGGQQIEIVEVDETGDPEFDVKAAQALVDQDGVDLIGGIYSTPVLYAVRDYLERSPRKVMLVVANAGGNELDTTKKSDHVVGVSHSNSQFNRPLGRYAAGTLGLRKVCLSSTDFARGRESLDAFGDGFVRAGGEIVDEVFPPVGVKDFGPYLSRIDASGADCVFNFYAVYDAIEYFSQASQSGVSSKMRMLNVSTLDEPLLPLMGESALGFLSGYVL